MTAAAAFDRLMERLSAGERLASDDIIQLAATPDILSLGVLADVVRQRLHDRVVTYLRVASCPFNASFADAVPPQAREVRITGNPETLEVAITAVRSAKAVGGDRVVSGFSWADIIRLTSNGTQTKHVLTELRGAGLAALAELPIDRIPDLRGMIEHLTQAGFDRIRLTVEEAPAGERTPLLIAAGELQEEYGRIQALNPLPRVLHPERPTTGYEDVKMVAIARLAAPAIPTIQVDWLRYGPKLAQVALTFGADDLDGVLPSDEAPDGRRRAPLEEVRRNIQAAGFEAVERDGSFNVIGT